MWLGLEVPAALFLYSDFPEGTGSNCTSHRLGGSHPSPQCLGSATLSSPEGGTEVEAG